MLGFALSAIALAADSIVPAMVAHFANNACIIAIAVAQLRHEDGTHDPKLRLGAGRAGRPGSPPARRCSPGITERAGCCENGPE